jgi:hypothetical protein
LGEELREFFAGVHRAGSVGGLNHLREDFVSQEVDVVGEHREHELHEEVGGIVRRDAALAHAVGDLADDFSGLGGDGFGGLARAEGIRIGEDSAELVEVFGLGQLGERELVDLFGGARDVGVNLEAVEVANDEQRRVFEVFAVLEELLVGSGEVFLLAFVFPAEVAAEPDVGPAGAAFGFIDAALECVPSALGVGGGRFGLAEEVAEVEEMLLAGAALGELSGLSFLDERVGSQWKRTKA